MIAGVAIICALAWSAAAADATHVFSYKVTHARYGDIGTYDRIISEAGGLTHAQSRLKITVRIFGIVVHREVADQTEDWRGGRLMSFRSVTTTNGHPLVVSGEASGDSFVVTTPTGVATAPASVAASDPWGFDRTGPGVVVSIKTGRIDQVNVTGGEADTVMLHGVATRARHFRVSTATQPDRWEVWLDERDVPIKFRSFDHGDAIDFTLVSSAD